MVPKLCITGGPCGGKTSAMARISENLSKKGFYPLIVPEAATLLMKGNVSPSLWKSIDFQSSIIGMTLRLERTFERAANDMITLNPVLLCDRGIADSAAYCSEDAYLTALEINGISSYVAARDERYNGVFHLVSAAKGAEQFYTTENNSVRRETLAEAAELDDRTINAWTGTPHLRVIDNSTDFEGKLSRLEKEICAALGIPVPLEIEKKYLCAPVNYTLLPKGAQTVQIEQVYLFSEPGTTLRVRKRGQGNSFTYYRTEKKHISGGIRTEKERLISAGEYELSLQFQLPNMRPIRKRRTCFLFENQYFELDAIPQMGGSVLHLLEIELTDIAQTVSLPPFITVLEDVTESEQYTNFALAKVA